MTVTYTNNNARVILTYDDACEECDFSVLGAEQSDETLLALAEAGGADVDGWHCEVA